MEIMEIIKEAFIIPSQNLDKLAVYIVLTFIIGILFAGGIFSAVFGITDSSIYFIITAILFILGILVSFVLSGYHISLLKSGIDQDEKAPGFEWKDNLITGIKMLIVSIVYFIIPAIVFAILSLVTNIPGQVNDIAEQAIISSVNATAVANSSAPAVSAISQSAMASLVGSIAITGIIAAIFFIIFAFLQTMGQSRLANTGSLGEAVNIPEAYRDITRIGVGKTIGLVLFVIIIVAVIQGIIGYVSGQVPQLSIISIVVTPYLAFFTQRAIGLLYSDIA